MNKAQSATKSDIDKLIKRVDTNAEESQNGFARVNENFASVDENFAKVNENFTRVNENFARVNENFVKVNKEIEDVLFAINNMMTYL